jgi:hypothetical protein
MKRSTIARTLVFGTATALALSLAPIAKAERKPCSAATLKGTWARKDIGFILTAGSPASPFAGLSLVTFSTLPTANSLFDANGTLTAAGIANVNGTLTESTGRGTYKVNPDCSGTYTTQSSTGRTGTAFFVITDGGNEIHILPLGGTAVITCIARRVFPQGDALD